MSQRDLNSTRKEVDLNEDPVTGEHGSHPVGTGIGTAAGGAAAGAAAGLAGGPIGAVAGAIVGGIAGGLAGKAIAEKIDPTVENAYWEENYRSRDYVTADSDYASYEPAYRYGWSARGKYDTDEFTAVEKELERDWASLRGNSSLDWPAARPATQDAWNRVNREYGR
jgi:phage tail tape-measure protein